VRAVVAALACAAASLLGLATVILASATVGVLGAARDAADGEGSAPGHADHLLDDHD
jgi:hypothetical protein